MRKIYFSLLALTLMLVSTTAKAQYQAEVEVYPEKGGWYSGEQSFPAEDVATALGCEDVKALAALIENDGNGGNVYMKTGDDKSNAYTGGYNEFWMNSEGVIQAYDDEGSSWYAALRMSEDSTMVRVYMGQMPGFFVEIPDPVTLTCQLIVANGATEATFDVTLKIKPFINVPFTASVADLITIPTSVDVTITNGKKGDVEVDCTALITALSALPGVDLTVQDIQPVIDQMTAVEQAGEEDGYPTGKLLQYSSLGGLPLSYDSQNKLCYVPNFPEGQQLGDISFSAFTLRDPYLSDEGIYSFTADLTNNAEANNGKVRSFDLYVVYDKYALKIRVNVTVQEPVITRPEDMTQMGVANVELHRAYDAGFAADRYDLDVEGILAALDLTSADELQLYALNDNGEFSDNYTAEAPGFWLTQDGIIHAYSGATFYINYRTNGNYFDIGQMPGIFTGSGEEKCEGSVYFVSDGKYYEVHVTISINKEEQIEETDLVETKSYVLQLIPGAEWERTDNVGTFDLEGITTKIGGAPVIYTDKYIAPAEEGGEGTFEWTKSATCDPVDGKSINQFWYWKEPHNGIVSSTAYAENNNWTYALAFMNDGTITCFQRTGNNIGDQYLCHIYFVNESTGKYIQYNYTMKFVEEIDPNANAEEVATITDETVVNDYETYNINVAAIAEAFEVSEEEVGSATILILNAQGEYVPLSATSGYFYYNGKEYTEEPEGGIYPKGTAYVDVDPVDWTVTYEVQDPDDEGTFTEGSGDTGVVYLAFDLQTEEGLKRVAYTLTILSEGALDAIDDVKAGKTANKTVNLAGQQVNGAYKGIVIKGHKKFLVK